MSDWKHRTTEQARDALSRFCTRKAPVMTIPVDNERDADMILGDVIEERDSLLLQNAELRAEVKKLHDGHGYKSGLGGCVCKWCAEKPKSEKVCPLCWHATEGDKIHEECQRRWDAADPNKRAQESLYLCKNCGRHHWEGPKDCPA